MTDQTLNFFKMSPASSLNTDQIEQVINVFSVWTMKHLVTLADPTKPAMEDKDVKAFFKDQFQRA
jgi:hypothetical protein